MKPQMNTDEHRLEEERRRLTTGTRGTQGEEEEEEPRRHGGHGDKQETAATRPLVPVVPVVPVVVLPALPAVLGVLESLVPSWFPIFLLVVSPRVPVVLLLLPPSFSSVLIRVHLRFHSVPSPPWFPPAQESARVSCGSLSGTSPMEPNRRTDLASVGFAGRRLRWPASAIRSSESPASAALPAARAARPRADGPSVGPAPRSPQRFHAPGRRQRTPPFQ